MAEKRGRGRSWRKITRDGRVEVRLRNEGVVVLNL